MLIAKMISLEKKQFFSIFLKTVFSKYEPGIFKNKIKKKQNHYFMAFVEVYRLT